MLEPVEIIEITERFVRRDGFRMVFAINILTE